MTQTKKKAPGTRKRGCGSVSRNDKPTDPYAQKKAESKARNKAVADDLKIANKEKKTIRLAKKAARQEKVNKIQKYATSIGYDGPVVCLNTDNGAGKGVAQKTGKQIVKINKTGIENMANARTNRKAPASSKRATPKKKTVVSKGLITKEDPEYQKKFADAKNRRKVANNEKKLAKQDKKTVRIQRQAAKQRKQNQVAEAAMKVGYDGPVISLNSDGKPRTKNCPRCGTPLPTHPALSRVDDRTKICNTCGMSEAVADARGRYDSGTPYYCYTDLPGHTVLIYYGCPGYREISPTMRRKSADDLNAKIGISDRDVHRIIISTMRGR